MARGIHLRTTNPIELTFATVRHRTKVTKRPGSKATGMAMAFKLIEAAQERWRAVNAPHLVALVRAGARFECGKLVERDPVLEGHPSRRRHPCSVARRLESTRQQRRVMIFIRSQEDGMIHSVGLPRTTSRSS